MGDHLEDREVRDMHASDLGALVYAGDPVYGTGLALDVVAAVRRMFDDIDAMWEDAPIHAREQLEDLRHAIAVLDLFIAGEREENPLPTFDDGRDEGVPLVV